MKPYLLSILFLYHSISVLGQCVVSNNDDYTITASFSPTTIIPNKDCLKGPGSMAVQFDYFIKVEGRNVPNEPVYYYQASLSCGNVVLSPISNLPITKSEINGTQLTSANYFSNGDCSSSTPESLNCYGRENITFIGSGPNGWNFQINCESIVPAFSPYLENFSANLVNGTYKISWQTLTQGDIEYFMVEKSKDSKEFLAISDRLVASDRKKYDFIDNDKSTPNYYRIMISLKTGEVIYTKTFGSGGG